MKTQTIGYWVTTGIIAALFLFGGVTDLSRSAQVVEGMNHLGYPAYFISLLGVWKLLGAVAIVAPRFPLLKEWAYAGMFFDMSGAAVSHASSGDPLGRVLFPVILLAVLVASWALRPSSRRLQGVKTLPSSKAAAAAYSHA
jgi:hypothetical protein